MTRDYKPAPPKPERKSNPFLNGFVLGLLVGVAIAVGFTVYIKGGESPFTAKSNDNVTIASVDPFDTKKEALDKLIEILHDKLDDIENTLIKAQKERNSL